MDLEFHQLDLRYEELRSRSPARERRLLSSLAEAGQQTPIVVVRAAEASAPIVIDGYKRVRLLRKLGQDTVRATSWALDWRRRSFPPPSGDQILLSQGSPSWGGRAVAPHGVGCPSLHRRAEARIRVPAAVAELDSPG